ncbi:putative ATP-dependent protease [Magnetospirillum sp. XM-1]|uniref:Lon protease family protein n=1 Tax=Magnetospirillum sp. XM-1 TaxID=1663591 RepID=UPI00073DF5F8|nr:AAA family ATPase [Magnetospirillum sp. XM-1]CUW37330.1 putative ATP-dependent protease [Magnetospirillum sp. XM-1]
MSKRKPAAHPVPLSPEALYRVCDPALFDFATTADLPDEADEPGPALGQDRAVEAIRFAIGMRHRGFNLFALGEEGTGRRNLILGHLREAAAARPPSDDWGYVENFAEAARPRALRLPAGRARALERDMAHLVEELGHALPAAFEAEEYRARRQMVETEAKQQREEAFSAIQQDAEAHGIALIRTPMGLGLAPSKGDEVLPPDEFKQLPDEVQTRLRAEMERLQERLESTIKQVPRWERDTRTRLRELEREAVGHAIAHLMDDLKGDWADLPEVLAYLDEVAGDVALNAQDFLPEADDAERREGRPRGPDGRFRKYRVNVLVCREGETGAPVVMETYPTQPNIIGRVEHIAQYGTLITDFNLIKAGSLHRANGGYLVLDALKLLMHPFAWEDLKRALRDREIRIESPGQAMGLISTLSLEPQPIPLDVKVVLVGDPMLYYLLSHNDPEFSELFKVSADFDWRMDRSEANTVLLARSVAGLARKEGLRPLERGAVARIVEQASREVGDSSRLSTHMASLADLVREADYWAGEDGAAHVSAAHVARAVAASVRRLDRVRDNVQEEMLAGTVHINTEGEAVGQINGLAVLELGRFSFGRPTRVTARVRFGKGDVVDIEREVQLGGPIHGKGVMILSSYLASRYATELPMALSATLVFEQSYGGIEGDSASSTELYALLSALADLPIRQNLAVTGSIDQFGRIQAIGGVNEKIEGFFDLCRARGLDGSHGVLIPAANVRHLMLREDVVEAARAGLFSVYPVETVDQGMTLLTGVPAGERDADGKFPTGSINRRVAARLGAFMRRAEDLALPRPPVGMGRNGNGG